MARRALILIPALALLAAGTASGFACSAGNDPTNQLETGGAGGTTTHVGGQGGDGAGQLGGGGNSGFDAGDTDGNLTDGDTCAATEAQAEKIPLDMILVVDRSGSMSGTQWNGTVTALTSFFQDSSSDGISVGMNFYPEASVNNCPSGYAACDPDIYGDAPAYNIQVPIDVLPGYAPTLVGILQGESPDGYCTPTYGALFGSLAYAVWHQDNNPNRKVIVVFASDGSPNGCESTPINQNDTGVIAGIAQSAYNYNSVETYVIAIQGSSVAALNQIAAAGGTGQAFDVTNDVSLFLQKMEEIRSAALGCEYVIPEPEPPEVFDPLKVNVLYTPSGGGDQETIPQADDLADCGNGDGWYFDDPVDPSRIILCPATCQDIQSDSEALVNIAFGCPTEVN